MRDNVQLTFFGVALMFMIAEVLSDKLWKNHVIMNSIGDYHVFWDWDDQNVTFEVQVRTKGYVGFGFSPNGGMKGADIVIGWVKGNGVHLQDRFATENAEPIVDKSQDYYLLSGFENDTHTVLRFTRKKDTCDDNDFKITEDTMRLIYAWHDEDPDSQNNIKYHGIKYRGAKSVKLFGKQFDEFNFRQDVYTWDMKMPEIKLPPIRTSYRCKYFKFPAQHAKHHRVGMDVVVQPENNNFVHHVTLYSCIEEMYLLIQNKLNDPAFDCIDDKSFMSLCPAMIISRPFGKQGEALPPDVGVPFGHIGKPVYFLLQVHYTNPELRDDIVDQTVMRMYITEKLRPYEGGLIIIRSEKTFPLIIPPKQKSFAYTVVSPAECTKLFPDEGINVYAVNFHMHLTGRKGYARHFRNDVELPLLAEDNYYDFNYQQPTELSKEVKVLPGDLIEAQCVYDTMDRTNLTLGGSETVNEMCTIIVYYYPASNLAMCIATGSVKELLQIFKVEELWHDNIHIKLPMQLRNMSLTEYLENFNVTSLTEDEISDIELVQIQDPVLAGKCVTKDNKVVPYITERPNITSIPYIAPHKSCNNNNTK